MNICTSKRINLYPLRHCCVGSFSVVIFILLLGSFIILKVSERKFDTSYAESFKSLNEQDNMIDLDSSGSVDTLPSERNDEESQQPTSNCNYKDFIFGQPVEQDNPCLIAAFKERFLVPPPPPSQVNRAISRIAADIPSNKEKLKWIEKLIIERPDYDQEKGGYFIEMGANDGMYVSGTIRLEMKYNWTGLLVEAAPIPFKKLLTRKRNCLAVNTAACTTQHPQQLTFYSNPKETGRSGLNEDKRHGVVVTDTVQCIPLYTMLLALGVTSVDYFNLDVEGAELGILETIPFDKISFKVFTIEYHHIPGKEEALEKFFQPRGYKYVKHITDFMTKDVLYVHESLYELATSIRESGIFGDKS